MQNDPKSAPENSGAEATERDHPAASEIPTPGTGPESDPAFGPGPSPEPGFTDGLPPSLAAMMGGAPGLEARVECFTGHPVEIAADIIGNLRLSPRDLVTLASALLCTVVERAQEDWPANGPFHHIKLDGMDDLKVNSPFKVGIACLQVVDSWGNGGAFVPDPVAH